MPKLGVAVGWTAGAALTVSGVAVYLVGVFLWFIARVLVTPLLSVGLAGEMAISFLMWRDPSIAARYFSDCPPVVAFARSALNAWHFPVIPAAFAFALFLLISWIGVFRWLLQVARWLSVVVICVFLDNLIEQTRGFALSPDDNRSFMFAAVACVVLACCHWLYSRSEDY